MRLGCAFNGCCGGRETHGWCGVWLHDTRGVRRRRVPVQFLEMAWWLLGGIGFIWLWPRSFPPGNYALGVLAWYGLGRFFLEPLREAPDLVAGRVRINQCVAAALVLGRRRRFAGARIRIVSSVRVVQRCAAVLASCIDMGQSGMPVVV